MIHLLFTCVAVCICGSLLSHAASHAGTTEQQATEQAPFANYVLQCIQKMPRGGGYSGTPETVNHLVGHVISWNESQQKLEIHPRKAQPSFCSGACYLVLLQSLQLWEKESGRRLSTQAWKSFAMSIDQPDGHGVWGRANANGPGFAKLVADVGAGVNFTDIQQARPGDFLKIFWTPNIGRKERGHLVVYRGTLQQGGKTYIKYWSANKPEGYGIKTAPLQNTHNLIFTRITAPLAFNNTPKLPATDSWLENMLSQDFSFTEVRRKCNIQKQANQK